jgi:hypothetical protein
MDYHPKNLKEAGTYTSFRGLASKKSSYEAEPTSSSSASNNLSSPDLQAVRSSARNTPVIRSEDAFATKEDSDEFENPFHQKSVAEVSNQRRKSKSWIGCF